MGAGIVRGKDKGAVGFSAELGMTWHGFPEYEMINGPLSLAKVREKVIYPVQKIALAPALTGEQLSVLTANVGEETLKRILASTVPTMFALMRMDTGDVLYDYSVTDDYTVILNEEFLATMEASLLAKFPEVGIESCGTLFAGRVAFVNILLDVAEVKGDNSKTAFRLMYYNAFGGKSIAAGMHGVRIVCNNTLTWAEAQAAANNTLAKYKHVSGAPGRVQAHLVELAELHSCVKEHKATLDRMAEQTMTDAEVGAFFTVFIDIPDEASKRMGTRRQNKRDAIREIFETRDDLQGDIAQTRYSLLQAVTYYTEHETVGKRDVDEAYAYFDSVTGGGRDTENRLAFDILQTPDLIAAANEAKAKAKAEGKDASAGE